MANYLVTGAAGFIGSKLSKALIDSGNSVVTIDNLSTGKKENIPLDVIFIEGDCQSNSTISQLSKYKFDAVFHIAGQSSGEVSFDQPVYDLQTNTQSTLMLLDYCVKSGCKKFFYASSMSVYGDVPNLPIAEDYYPNPKSFYGIGKLASEHYCRIYTAYGISCTALRLFNVYGPGQNLDNMRQGMVSIFLSQALRNEGILVKGAANRFRDFVYIDDVVNAFLLADANQKTNCFMLANIASGVRTTVREVVETIIEALDKDINTQYEGSTPGDQFGIFGDANFAARNLNWSASMPFVQGVKKMVDWAKTL